MKSSTRRLVLLAPVLGAAIAMACSSSSSDPSTVAAAGSDAQASDSASAADTATSVDAASEAATDAGCSAYTGPIPADAGAQCHDLVNTASAILPTADPGAMPVGKGGVSADGLYHLTEVRTYPGSPYPAGVTAKITALVLGDTSYTVEDNSNDVSTVRQIKKRNPDGGAELVLCTTKPINGGEPVPTSGEATCTTLRSFDANFKFATTLTKQ
jgi:hypothetical protein